MRDNTDYKYPDDPFSFGNAKRMDTQIKDEKEVLKREAEKKDERRRS